MMKLYFILPICVGNEIIQEFSGDEIIQILDNNEDVIENTNNEDINNEDVIENTNENIIENTNEDINEDVIENTNEDINEEIINIVDQNRLNEKRPPVVFYIFEIINLCLALLMLLVIYTNNIRPYFKFGREYDVRDIISYFIASFILLVWVIHCLFSRYGLIFGRPKCF